MPIRELSQFREMEEELRALKLVGKLRPLMRLLGERGRDAYAAMGSIRELETQFEEMRSMPDQFNAVFGPLGWIYHEYINVEVTRRALAAAASDGIDAGEAILAKQLFDAKDVRFALTRVRRFKPFAIREKAIAKTFELHEKGYHSACANEMLSYLDGIMIDLTGGSFFVKKGADTSYFIIEDSVVGHPEGLVTLANLMSARRDATTTNAVSIPYRHGIEHGRDVNYDNELVSAKCIAALLALCAFAPEYDQRQLKQWDLVRSRPSQKPSMSAVARSLAARADGAAQYLSFPQYVPAHSRRFRNAVDDDHPLPWIPEFGSYELARVLQRLGFECAPPHRLFGAVGWSMRSASVGPTYDVSLTGTEPRKIYRAEAMFWGPVSEPALDFLAFFATVPYAGFRPDIARAWLIDNIHENAEMTIGPARFNVIQLGAMIELKISSIELPHIEDWAS